MGLVDKTWAELCLCVGEREREGDEDRQRGWSGATVLLLLHCKQTAAPKIAANRQCHTRNLKELYERTHAHIYTDSKLCLK